MTTISDATPSTTPIADTVEKTENSCSSTDRTAPRPPISVAITPSVSQPRASCLRARKNSASPAAVSTSDVTRPPIARDGRRLLRR